MDREVLCFLMFKLHRDVTQSLLVMALWLWLENVGYPDLVPRVIGLPYALVNALVDEAVSCLKCLETENPTIPPGGGLPFTTRLMRKNISLKIFILKRYTTIAGIKSVLNNTCTRIFNDVLCIVLKSRNIMTSQRSGTTSRLNALNMPLVLPGFPHPLFGTFDLSMIDNQNNLLLPLSDERIWGMKRPCDDANDEDKSMFLTFSRGFPVSEFEVRYLFTEIFGDCVQSLTMGGENSDVNQQHLFAIMILKTVTMVDQILMGKRVAKLQVNGKHIWARKYTCRDY